MKQCTCCLEQKELTSYHTKRRKKIRKDGSIHEWVGTYAECKECWLERDRKTRDKYAEYYKEYSKNYPKDKRKNSQLKHDYGITLEKYYEILKEQEGKCLICGSYDTGREGSKFFHVDHCHNTGTVRGLLCNGCNIGLGAFKDNTTFLEKAVQYLKQFEKIAPAIADALKK